jgi:hypothetical protein
VWGYLSWFSPLLFVQACSPVCLRGGSVFVGFSRCPSISHQGNILFYSYSCVGNTIFVPV